jgi:hypothetical protein
MLAIVGAIAYMVTRNRDEETIRKQLDVLAATASKGGLPEAGGAYMKKMLELRSLFTVDCTLDVASAGVNTRGADNLIMLYSQSVGAARELIFSFHDISVTVAEDRRSARTPLTVKTVSSEPLEGLTGIDAWEVEMGWEKIDGHWKIASIAEVQTLR